MRKKHQIVPSNQPSTKQVLVSLSSEPGWCRLLLDQPTQSFSPFLNWLLNNAFGAGHDTLQGTAKASGFPTAIMTRWIHDIYAAIFTLNDQHPDIFRTTGMDHRLEIQHHQTYVTLDVTLNTTPRVHEAMLIPFLHARLGFHYFYVEAVHHVLKNACQRIDLLLKGGFANRYRSWLIDRADFEGRLSAHNLYQLPEWQIDDLLRKQYR